MSNQEEQRPPVNPIQIGQKTSEQILHDIMRTHGMIKEDSKEVATHEVSETCESKPVSGSDRTIDDEGGEPTSTVS